MRRDRRIISGLELSEGERSLLFPGVTDSHQVFLEYLMSLGERLSFRKFKAGLIVGLAIVLALFAVFSNIGCQVGGTVSLGASSYWPDAAGDKDKTVGDPRKERYAPGNTQTDEKFHGLKGGD